jgi:hypothetical protein
MAAQLSLLHTNALADLLKHPGGAARGRIKTLGEETTCTSVALACELLPGLRTRELPRCQRGLTNSCRLDSVALDVNLK